MQTIVEKTQDSKLKIDHQGTPQKKTGMNGGFLDMKVNECLMFGNYRSPFTQRTLCSSCYCTFDVKQQ